jgi:excisionase family DNA binding protein
MESWLTIKEVAPIVKMSEQALYAAIREGQFPAIRIGRRIRISPDALREWGQIQPSVSDSSENQPRGKG